MVSRYADLVLPLGATAERWHRVRQGGLGGSDVAAVLALSPWMSRFSLWHQKSGLDDGPPENAGMSWGTRLEPVIADAFAEAHPGMVVRRSGTWRSRARPVQLANPDRLITGCPHTRRGGRCVLECKTDARADEWGETGGEGIPIYYRVQGIWYSDVLGVDHFHVAVLLRGQDFRHYLVWPEPAEYTLLRQEGAAFWQTVLDGERPDIDGHSDTYRVIRAQHPLIDRNLPDVQITPELRDQYRDACARLVDAEHAKQLAVSTILDQMGLARRAVCRGGEHGVEHVAIRVPGRGGSIALRESKPKNSKGKAA